MTHMPPPRELVRWWWRPRPLWRRVVDVNLPPTRHEPGVERTGNG